MVNTFNSFLDLTTAWSAGDEVELYSPFNSFLDLTESIVFAVKESDANFQFLLGFNIPIEELVKEKGIGTFNSFLDLTY